MTTVANFSTNTAIFKTSAVALTSAFDRLEFFQVMKIKTKTFHIQKVLLKYSRCGEVVQCVSGVRIVNSLPMAKTLATLLNRAKLASLCHGEIFYCGPRFYNSPAHQMFVVIKNIAYYNVVKVLQYADLQQQKQDRHIIHSAHMELKIAIKIAKYCQNNNS